VNDADSSAPAPSRWTRRLKCPHCSGEFDYDLVPSASFTAVRLGASRYMRCPLCHRFGLFALRRAMATGTTPPAPRFSDRRTFLKWGTVLLVPALALLFFGAFATESPGVRLAFLAAGGTVLLGGAGLVMLYVLPQRIR